MVKERFSEQMQAYGRWKAGLTQSIRDYQRWAEDNGLDSPEDQLRMIELLEVLTNDRLTVAFVAEFARGKTELINAIFFSEYDRRLLPSEPGRTTMCPTELFYDSDSDQAYVRLLPIETRLDDTSIAEYKRNPVDWVTIPLDTRSPERMAEAFKEVVQTKRVSLDQARRLGLYDDQVAQLRGGTPPAEVEIPKWRHGLISFPHPLLKQGLTILDTPGLNALGAEPELTLSMLPSAQAVVFVLAADTGVTKSDLDMWQTHVRAHRGARQQGLITVLNKIDTLWDELKDEDSIARSIAAQRTAVAQMLDVDPARIFPVSAQKGLLAKIRHDQQLLERSNVLALEQVLSNDIVPGKQQILREMVVAEMGAMAGASRRLIASRQAAMAKQRIDLAQLSGKNEKVIEHLMKKTRDEQVAYHRSVESFQSNKRVFAQQCKRLLQVLSLGELDTLVAATREEMTGSWTTIGLKRGMKAFFEGVTDTMKQAGAQTDQVNMLIQSIYRRFHQLHGLPEAKPELFDLAPYRRELEQLHREAEAFRNSPATTMTEQNFVIKKFFISLVSHARNTVFKAHHQAENWSKAVMAPLVAHIKEHKRQTEHRLESLRRINESKDTLQGKLDELERHCAQLQAQLGEIDRILTTLKQPLRVVPAQPADQRIAV